jgi:thioesterase domain-containing protein
MTFFSATQNDPDNQAIRRFMEESVDLKPYSKMDSEVDSEMDSKDLALSAPVPAEMSAIESWALFKNNFEQVKIRAGHRSILSEPHVKIITDYVTKKLVPNHP